MQDGPGGAHDPHIVAHSPGLEEARDLAVRHARHVERDELLVERAAVVVPDEPVAAGRASDRVEVVTALAPDAVDRLLAEARRRQPLEALAIVAKDRRAGARHQDGAARQGLDPPQIAGMAGLHVGPSLAVEVQDERSVALVRSHGVDVARRTTAHREQGRGELAREQLPRQRPRGLRRRRLAAGGRRERGDERDERKERSARGLLHVHPLVGRVRERPARRAEPAAALDRPVPTCPPARASFRPGAAVRAQPR